MGTTTHTGTTLLTFDHLCALEPRLRDLETEVTRFAEGYRLASPRCANAAFYGYGPFLGKGIKPRLVLLVGIGREIPGFRDPSEAARESATPTGPFRFIDSSEFLARGRARDEALGRFLESLSPDRRAAERLLRSSAAYDVVYDRLYDLLPDCRGCACA